MRIVLWQNCLSPHQLPYIVHLLDDERVDEVVVAVGEIVSGDRKNMGWSVEQYEGIDKCKIYIHPNGNEINEMLVQRKDDSYHFFSGIRADAFVLKCIQLSMAYNLHRGIITERPNRYDFKRDKQNAKPYWMHRLRFWLQDRKYAQKMQYVFAMGEEAAEYYKSLGMNWDVFPFCYCTYSPVFSHESQHLQEGDSIQYTYCGSLSKRKDPITIVKSLNLVEKRNLCKVRIIGDGPLRSFLETEISNEDLTDSIQLLGTKPLKDVPLYMQQTDVFILPSLYDGWGAVVNEALQSGCYVMVTDACGAADLIKQDKRLGCVFKSGDYRALADCINYVNSHISEVRVLRQWRRNWADQHISGRVVAKYMIDCICNVHKPQDKPLWKI